MVAQKLLEEKGLPFISMRGSQQCMKGSEQTPPKLAIRIIIINYKQTLFCAPPDFTSRGVSLMCLRPGSTNSLSVKFGQI